MPSPVEPSLFDTVERFAADVDAGRVMGDGSVQESSAVIQFCESFFDQFFAHVVGVRILGFGPVSKTIAASAAVARRGDASAQPVRSLIALFEKFCDLHAEVLGGDYGSAHITYRKFHSDYMRKLLERAETWARQDAVELADRIARARGVYDATLGARGW